MNPPQVRKVTELRSGLVVDARPAGGVGIGVGILDAEKIGTTKPFPVCAQNNGGVAKAVAWHGCHKKNENKAHQEHSADFSKSQYGQIALKRREPRGQTVNNKKQRAYDYGPEAQLLL